MAVLVAQDLRHLPKTGAAAKAAPIARVAPSGASKAGWHKQFAGSDWRGYWLTLQEHGWGARCRQHLNAGEDPTKACCKTSISDRSGRMSSDEMRLRMMQ